MFDWVMSILIFFIGASILLYVIMGGADYGAGILELLPSRGWRVEQRKLVNHAMGPVWEANHIWLILLIVILFMGFPQAFEVIMISLHIPLFALLVGIVIRGGVFAFRHYDPKPTKFALKAYTIIFGFSSLWSAFWIGVTAASLFRGQIDSQATDFYSAYIHPWFGWGPVSMGVFVVFNYSYLASLFLVGEVRDEAFSQFIMKRGLATNIAMVITGGLVFLASYYDGDHFAYEFWHNPVALACVAAATLLFVLLWTRVKKRNLWLTRAVAAGQTSLILFAWYFVHAPHLLSTRQGWIDFTEAAAPHAVLVQLLIALGFGSLFIFPSLYFLLYVFKRRPE